MAWARAQPAVFSYIRSQVKHHHDAEDLLQRVASTAIQKQAQYDPERPFVAWALGLARYEIMRYRDEHGRDRLVFSDAIEEQIADSYKKQADGLLAMGEALSFCIQTLSGKSRQVLELHYLRHESGARIGQMLGMTSNAVFVLLHRLRTNLRHCITRRLQGEA